jgi:hypothetical protein
MYLSAFSRGGGSGRWFLGTGFHKSASLAERSGGRDLPKRDMKTSSSFVPVLSATH